VSDWELGGRWCNSGVGCRRCHGIGRARTRRARSSGVQPYRDTRRHKPCAAPAESLWMGSFRHMALPKRRARCSAQKSVRTAPGTGAAATSLPAPPAAGAALPAAEAGSNLTCLSAMVGVHSTTCKSQGPCGRNTCGQRHECACSVDEDLRSGNGWLPWHVPWRRAAVHAGAKATQFERQRHR
jgi:hypothetical protein